MSRWFVWLAGCGLLAAFSPQMASASPSTDNLPVIKPDDGPKRPGLPIEGVVTNPDWIARPSGEDVARYYPVLANVIGLSGRAELSCAVSTLGMVGDCKVVVEMPTGLGFGAAALRMAPLFRMKPKTVDGAPVGGSRVNIPLHFLMDRAPPPPDSTPVGGAVTKAMALARRLAVATRGMSDAAFADNYVSRVEAQTERADAASDVDEATRLMVMDSFRKACLANMPRMTDITASALAAVYSEDELAKIVDFAESPAGQAWFSKQSDILSGSKTDFSTLWGAITRDARARFCAQKACPPPPAAPEAPP